MQILTNSRRACFQRCRREHLYSYIMGIRPRKTAKALGFGSLFHAGLEQWWLAWADVQARELPDDDKLPLTLGLNGIKASYTGLADDADLDEFDVVKAEELMRGYHYRWKGEIRNMDVLAVEERFTCRLVNPDTGRPSQTFELSGKLDAIVAIDNQIYIVEHKTTSSDISPASDYWLRLRIDGQVSTYFEGGRALGHDVYGCVYDVIRKPTQIPLKATPEDKRKFKKDGSLYANQRLVDEGPEEYRLRIREAIAGNPEKHFQRGNVVRLATDQREFACDAWLTAQSMRLSQNYHAHPRNPDACVRYGNFCSYFDVCTGADSIHNDIRFRQSRVVHPELVDEAPKEEALIVE